MHAIQVICDRYLRLLKCAALQIDWYVLPNISTYTSYLLMTRSSTNRQGTSRRVCIEGPDSGGGNRSGFFSSRSLGLAAMAAERRRTQERLRALENCAYHISRLPLVC